MSFGGFFFFFFNQVLLSLCLLLNACEIVWRSALISFCFFNRKKVFAIMFIIFSLLLWYCRNKLVLWLVSSWDDMRGEKKWMLAEVAPRCMPGLAAMQGLMASQLWVPGQIGLSQHRQDMESPWRPMHLCLLCFLPFPCSSWLRTTSAVVPCPQQLVCATGIPCEEVAEVPTFSWFAC